MEAAGLVRSSRHGRESIFEVDPAPLRQAQDCLSLVSQRWDNALSRLKAFVEEP